MNNIYIVHKDWSGKCLLNDKKIQRVDYNDEYGIFELNNNKLTIKWKKWNEETFYCTNNNIFTYYLEDIYLKDYKNIIIYDKESIFLIILDKEKNIFYLWDKKIYGLYTLRDNLLTLTLKNITKEYIKLNNDIFINNNIFFCLKIEDKLIEENYIYRKDRKKFYSISNNEELGDYKIVENSLYMNWNNGYKKRFYTDKYLSNKYDISDSNIRVIKAKNIFFENKVLFSNISLCKNKIVLTSMNYIHDPHQIDNIHFTLECSFKKHIYDNRNIYEPSLIFLLELDEYLDNVILTINYKENVYEIYLEQLNIVDHKISAMTLFQDDYPLLKKYLEYYQHLGINLFYIYYNKELDYKIIEYITNISNGINVYLIEWDYFYWWKYNNGVNHHHAQTMAINDALHILKNYSQYLLYNDLDEYFLLGKYRNIDHLIEDNKDVEIFIFKNRFCKIGNSLIKYEDFYEKFDLTKIIEGNYWDKGREKNIIRLDKINIMGIHSTFDLKSFTEYIVNQFYHIINFKEKYRENLMTQYIG